MIAKEERLANRKKVKFAQPTQPARTTVKKRESKATVKDKAREVRKSSRQSVIDKTTEVQTKIEASAEKINESFEEKPEKAKRQLGNASNTEWAGMIYEIQQATRDGLVTEE